MKKPKKPVARPLKAKFKLPAKFKINMSWVVLHPPPTELKKCPRCEKPHKKIKPLKFGKPMRILSPDGKLNSQASHWVLCPKTKEPVILFDQVSAGESIENLVMKQAADDIATQIDKEILADLAKVAAPSKPEPKKRGKKAKKEAESVSVTATLSDPKVWVYDPNAPARVVPGTKAKAAAQKKRVKAQVAAAAPKRAADRRRRR